MNWTTGWRLFMRAQLVVLLIFVPFSRFIFCANDPPRLSWSRGEYTDPGFYLNNARSLVLTGEYMVGDWNNGILFPVFHSLAYGAYLVGGYAVTSIGGLMALVALATALLLFLWLSRQLSFEAGWLGVVWFALAAPLLLLGRVPLLENLLLLLLVALLAVISWNETRVRHGVLLIIILLALGTKYSALFIVIPLLGIAVARSRGWLADTPPSRAEWIWIWVPLLLLAGLAGGALLSFKPAVLLATLGDKLTRYRGLSFGWDGKEPLALLLPVESNFFWRVPLLTLSAWLGWGMLLFRQRRWFRADAFAVLAVIGWYLSIVFVRYNPLRYQLPVVPFLLYLAVRFWTAPAEPFIFSRRRAALWWSGSVVLAYSALYTAVRSFELFSATRGQMVAVAAGCAVLALALIPLLARWPRRFPHWLLTYVVMLPIFAISFPQLVSDLRIDLTDPHSNTHLQAIGRDLERLVPPGETVAGWYAPSACLHNRVRVYTTYDLTPEKIAAHRVRYLLLETWGPGTPPLAAAPDGKLFPLRDRLRPLGEWTIPRVGRSLALYEVLP